MDEHALYAGYRFMRRSQSHQRASSRCPRTRLRSYEQLRVTSTLLAARALAKAGLPTEYHIHGLRHARNHPPGGCEGARQGVSAHPCQEKYIGSTLESADGPQRTRRAAAKGPHSVNEEAT